MNHRLTAAAEINDKPIYDAANSYLWFLFRDPWREFGCPIPASLPCFSPSWKIILTPKRHVSVFVLSHLTDPLLSAVKSCTGDLRVSLNASWQRAGAAPQLRKPHELIWYLQHLQGSWPTVDNGYCVYSFDIFLFNHFTKIRVWGLL